MTTTEFKSAMNRCHTRFELINLFSAHWSGVAGTFEELTELREAFGYRYQHLGSHPYRPLSEEGVCGAGACAQEEAA